MAKVDGFGGRGAQRRVTFTSVGKNVTMPEMTVTPISPRPKTSAIRGVMATSGTERNTIATGMSVCSTLRHNVKAIATTSAATVPAADGRCTLIPANGPDGPIP